MSHRIGIRAAGVLCALLALACAAPAAMAGPPLARAVQDPAVAAIQRGFGRTTCSGLMLGPDTVLTAAACVFESGARRPLRDLSVIVGLHDPRDPAGPDPRPGPRRYPERLYLVRELADRLFRYGYAHQGAQQPYFAPLDLAVIRLAPDPAALVLSVPPLIAIEQVTADHPDGIVAAALAFSGYADDLRPATQFVSRCDGFNSTGRLIFADCRSATAMAGGPLALLEPGAVFGINYGARVPEENIPGAGSFVPLRGYQLPDLALLAAGSDEAGLTAFTPLDMVATPFTGVEVWNRCRASIGVAIRYFDALSETWVVKGFYDVPPGGYAALPAPTRHPEVFWTAYRHDEDYFRWRGNAWQGDLKGVELDMLRAEPPEPGRDIRLMPACRD